MTYQHDFLVFIGRFQPFHNGHLKVVKEALKKSHKLIILLGSSHQPRNLRNPWTYEEREAMIRQCLSPEESKRVITAPLMDVMYNDELWVKNIQTTVNGLVTAHYSTIQSKPRIALIGHSKDHSSYYLNLFPQWGSVAVEDFNNISATPIRDALFQVHQDIALIIDQINKNNEIPDGAFEFIKSYIEGDTRGEYLQLCNEQQFISKYKKAWDAAPYPPTFITVDAVVIQSGHVLLVERRAEPGKGLLALPGGFVDQHERLVDACLRELKEETKLKVPAPVLKGSIKESQVFDDPHRSMRGRTITHAFYIELEPNSELPKVKGGDDASKAFWLPLSDLNPEHLFEDHYFIIQKLLGEH